MELLSRNEIIANVFSTVFPDEKFKNGTFSREINELTLSEHAELRDWHKRFHYAAEEQADLRLGERLIQALQQLAFDRKQWAEICLRDYGVTVDPACAKNVYIGSFMTSLIVDFE